MYGGAKQKRLKLFYCIVMELDMFTSANEQMQEFLEWEYKSDPYAIAL